MCRISFKQRDKGCRVYTTDKDHMMRLKAPVKGPCVTSYLSNYFFKIIMDLQVRLFLTFGVPVSGD